MATQYYEKNSGLFALFQYDPIYAHVNADYVILFKNTQARNNSGANYPRDIKFCTGTQVWRLHNIMKRIPVFLRYFNMPPFTPMLTQTMLFYLKRPKPGNNSGANYPRDIKFAQEIRFGGYTIL